MTEVLNALERLSKDVAKLASIVEQFPSKLVPPAKVSRLARSIADAYFSDIHGYLQSVKHFGLADEIEFVVGAILQLSSEPREKTAYLGQVKEIRPYLQKAMIEVMKARGSERLVLSPTERGILDTLSRMLPSTAASYQQVLTDISGAARVSWRGTGAELREVLREVMDHLAPDGEVMASPGFKLEGDLKRPTQKQRVRYILKARRRGVDVVDGALDTIEEGIPSLARSTYQRGSATTHAKTDATEVKRIKNYVDALLVELLEITV